MTRLECGFPSFGLGISPIHVFIAILVVLGSCKPSDLTHERGRFLQDLPEFEVVHPVRVDARGHFLSNFLSHRARRVRRREASEDPTDPDRVYYQILHDGHSLRFNLTLNPNLLAPGFLTERRYGGLEGARFQRPAASRCHFLGEVWDETTIKGRAALSTCDGLLICLFKKKSIFLQTGLFKLSDEEFFIQPLEKPPEETWEPQAHAIYKRHAPPRPQTPPIQPLSGKQALNATCGNTNSQHSLEELEMQRERWEHQRQGRRRRIRQRSVSKEKWVETLVVADPKMVDYHGSKAVESYVLAVMNIVAGLFRDATIGNAINIVVVRLILLEQDEDDLKITHHADQSLSSFCKWQKKLNMKGDEHPLHHDVAVLLTRKDICAAVNMPCETLGLSHVAGMCQPHRSCSISEDTGLPMAFTVAHELGHNFGIQHDGNGNDCEPIGKRPFVMSPQLLYGTSLPRWSRCSRQYITRFLDRGWGWCLDDAPVKDRLSVTPVLPGVLYSAVHQCRLQYGPGSLLCDDMDNVCSTLWCSVGTTCHSKLDGAVDGTSCGEDKWCVDGQCVAAEYHPESVQGGWALWSEWSACSRTCGAGVQRAERDCDNPVPKYRGRYCLGERQRYRMCGHAPCPRDRPSFRDLQCGHFNSLPYKGHFYKWEAVVNKVNPCELHCRPLNEHFSEKMRDAAADGTPCYEAGKSRDVCINGICQNVGCDYVIDSKAKEDRCGVCNGNSSTCTTVRRTFEESEGLGYVDIGLIPEGAWDILIEEVAAAGNFLALRSDNPSKYFLNGGWTIQWNGEYKAAGAVFTYERRGQLENLTSPGPTMEPVWIQEANPGVRYEYTISRDVSGDSSVPAARHFWKFGSWTECSVTCGAGVQRQVVHCVEKTTGIAEEHFCDPFTRPDDNQTSCNKDPCPAVWWVGDWQRCSSSCGSLGMAQRTVLCIQAVNAEERKALEPSECEHIPKPVSTSPCNAHVPCPAEWSTGSWSKCSVTCGSGVRHRNITCSRNTDVDCDPQKRPSSFTPCHTEECPQVMDNFGGPEWSGSGWPSKEVLNEINAIPAVKPAPKFSAPRSHQRPDGDLNRIVDLDFHYHNNIENRERGRENPVQVDDFYYDYNFINFHEDLSEDFESGTENSEAFSTKPTNSLKDYYHAETTPAPTALTLSEVHTLKTEDPQNTKGLHTKTGSEQAPSENVSDLLSEDYLLPVSATQPPLSSSSSVQHLQTEEVDKNPLWPENTSTEPGLLFSTKLPTEDQKWGQFEEVDENDDYGREENQYESLLVTPTLTVPTTTGTAQETGRGDVSREAEDLQSLNPLSSPMPGTKSQVEDEDRFDGTTFSIPQTLLQSTNFPGLFPTGNLDMYLSTSHKTDDSWETSRTAPPPTKKSAPLPAPFLLISGKPKASDDSIFITGTDITPPTKPRGATQPPPAGFLTATVTQIPTQPAFTDISGTDSSSQPLSLDLIDSDDNEILIEPVTGSSLDSHFDPAYQFITSTGDTPKLNETPGPLMDSPTPAASIPPSIPPGLRFLPVPTFVQTSASTPASGQPYWISSNWSTCSTTCGLGAIWRTLTCSTGSEPDCDPAKRPAPARQCYLRPCSTWKIGEWSKCSKNCESGVKLREVQCFDLRDQRLLRPFHCRAVSTRPPTQTPCNPQPCLSWYTSSWGQQRIVACPEEDRCDKDLQPANIQPCNSQPCAQWLTGSWGQCSASCGGGVKYRLIKCVDTKSETPQEVDPTQCDHEPQPDETQKCDLQECGGGPSGE
ncbi:unnamed protein product [Menidia menidia]|uniref:(Atlantic silverside) hypothetical protein n=1 Tax=Menidia menidia TaxID=238744 RepID=A0A8S4AFK7_9TELE|nr:unnamed protein product [Menidia menidia]